MTPIGRLAARVRERGWRGQRDAERVAEELCWDFPYGIPSFEDFNAALSPFVAGLDVDQAGAVKASVWCALPEEMREPAWQQLAEEIAPAVRQTRLVADEFGRLGAAA